VVGAGSVVTRDVPANSVAVGNPARVIRVIPSKNTDTAANAATATATP
jgi:maltose O-acetyltransferase